MWSSATCGSAIGHAGQLGINLPAGLSPVATRSARNDCDHGEVLRLPASTSGPSMWRTSCASSRISTSCRHGLPLGRLSCVPMMVVEPW
jgi:hypothetical protein